MAEPKMSAEAERLDALVVQFAEAMRVKLHSKLRQGWTGWDHPSKFRRDELISSLSEHVLRFARTNDAAQLIDVANLAAFIWNMDRLTDAMGGK